MNTAILLSASARPDRLTAFPGRNGETIVLRKDAIRCWPRPALGLALRVVTGCAWLTQEGFLEDVILEAGDCFTATGRGRLVVQSLSPELRMTQIAAIRRGS